MIIIASPANNLQPVPSPGGRKLMCRQPRRPLTSAVPLRQGAYHFRPGRNEGGDAKSSVHGILSVVAGYQILTSSTIMLRDGGRLLWGGRRQAG